ncbi:universal stress protein [Foetidibacter luteolus]|uniref:universal stress protein n=1 Tax=Foetidibacter luteolus TaxID=2608880 RepID=UPI00129BA39E|nr:universal stress protein [Foetidibacter luteolus]
MKNILLLTDFSEAAAHALEYACVLAGQLKASKLTLYHSFHTLADDFDAESLGPLPEKLYAVVISRLQALAAPVAARHKEKLVIDVAASDNPLEEEINTFCAHQHIDLIVMGAKGKTANRETNVGGTAVSIVHNAHYPVMIVPDLVPLQPVQSALLATDLQPMQKEAEETLTGFLRAVHPKLWVLNVDREEKNFGPDSSFELRTLHSLLGDFTPEFLFTEDADTVEGVERIAAEKSAGVIITIHKERSWLYQLLHGSVTERLAVNNNTVLLSLYNG